MRVSLRVLLVLAALPVSRPARSDDSSSAIDELKTGYALKQAGKCAEAIPHFAASFRADPKPKALLNRADCEEQTGDLVAARVHATQGRDLAQQQKDGELIGVADQQLSRLDDKLPRLTVRVPANAPAGVSVTSDGVAIQASSVGVAMALSPGPHHLVAKAPGHLPHSVDITLVEGDRQNIELEPGAATAVPLAVGAATPPTSQPIEASDASSSSARQILTYGAFGIGGAGIIAGIAVGVAAGSKHTALEGECTGNNCPLSAKGDLDAFHSLRTWSTVGYAVGLAGLAGGVALWLTTPKETQRNTARFWIGPASAGVHGSF
jgi:hypothetical protein